MIKEIRDRVKKLSPLIHCITNPISINQCANVILSAGARPMMAEHPQEVSVITATAGALLLNLGNFTDVRAESMPISARTAKENDIPFILDACGAACLPSRRSYALGIAEKFSPSVIKGNYSEIEALYSEDYISSGVDADRTLDTRSVEAAAAALAVRYGCVILASGAVDIVTDGKRLTRISNGTPQLGTITGTGCMQGALCAAYLAGGESYEAAVSCCCVLGICGEKAATDRGSGTFFVGLMDALSTVTDEDIKERLRTEEIFIEKN